MKMDLELSDTKDQSSVPSVDLKQVPGSTSPLKNNENLGTEIDLNFPLGYFNMEDMILPHNEQIRSVFGTKEPILNTFQSSLKMLTDTAKKCENNNLPSCSNANATSSFTKIKPSGSNVQFNDSCSTMSIGSSIPFDNYQQYYMTNKYIDVEKELFGNCSSNDSLTSNLDNISRCSLLSGKSSFSPVNSSWDNVIRTANEIEKDDFSDSVDTDGSGSSGILSDGYFYDYNSISGVRRSFKNLSLKKSKGARGDSFSSLTTFYKENKSKKLDPSKNTHVVLLGSNGKNVPKAAVDTFMFKLAKQWNKHNVTRKCGPIYPRGLYNSGDFCYRNVVLQTLLNCPPIFNFFEKSSEHISKTLKLHAPFVFAMLRYFAYYNRLTAVQTKHLSAEYFALIPSLSYSFNPYWIEDTVNAYYGNFSMFEHEQQDVDEFLNYALNLLETEIDTVLQIKSLYKLMKYTSVYSDEGNQMAIAEERAPKPLKENPIKQVFGGILEHTTYKGDNCSRKLEPFYTLPLDLAENDSILEALTKFSETCVITDYKTEEDGELKVQHQTLIHQLPVVLMLQLKCWSFVKGANEKVIKDIDIPTEFTFELNSLTDKSLAKNKRKYSLFSVIYHDGLLPTEGHYICDAYNYGLKKWVRYDDTLLHIVNDSYVGRTFDNLMPYMLFYLRDK